jgi:hypothetical protein
VLTQPLIYVVFAASDIVLLIAWHGHPRSLWSTATLLLTVIHLPPDTMYTFHGGEVRATVYDPRADKELTEPLCHVSRWPPSFLRSAGRPRAASRMTRLVTAQLLLYLCFFVLFCLSVIVVFTWLAVAVNWEWVFVLIFFLEWMAVSGYVGKCFFLGLRSIAILLLYGGNQGVSGGKNDLAIFGLSFIHFPSWIWLSVPFFILYVLPILAARKYIRSDDA